MGRRRLEPSELHVKHWYPMDGHNFVVAYPRCANCHTPILPKTPYFHATCEGYAKDRRGYRHRRERTRYICIDCKRLYEAFLMENRYDATIGGQELASWASRRVGDALERMDDDKR